MIDVCTWIHTLNTVLLLVSDMSNEHERPITYIYKLHPSRGIYRLLPMFYTSAYVCFTNTSISSLVAGRPINM